MIFKSVVKVKGSLLISETRCNQVWDIKLQTDDTLVCEMDAKTLDTPYCDSFTCKEAWIAMRCSLDKNTIIFAKYMKVNFLKQTIFKSKIIKESEKGTITNALNWLQQAEEGGFFKQQESEGSLSYISMSVRNEDN